LVTALRLRYSLVFGLMDAKFSFLDGLGVRLVILLHFPAGK